MKIVIASDHAGVKLKKSIRNHCESNGHLVADLGPEVEESVDYPDFAQAVAQRVSTGEFDRGILICGTGVGMQIAANKVNGIRAVAPNDEETAKLSRLHNDTNVVCFGARLQNEQNVLKLADLWLETPFEEGERHQRRVKKIHKFENDRCVDS